MVKSMEQRKLSGRESKMIKVVFLAIAIYYLPPTEGACTDFDNRCPRWASHGECERSPDLMRRDCPLSCGACVQNMEAENLEEFIVDSAKMQIKVFSSFLALFLGGAVIAIVKLYYSGGMCRSKGTLRGRTIVMTGCTSGIGRDAAFHLALRGAHLVIGCRSLKDGINLKQELFKETGNKRIDIKKCNLASLDSVREFAKEIIDEGTSVNILINNAGMISESKRTVTKDKFEATFQVNYLSHFLLTKLLMEKLKACEPSRIINVVDQDYSKGKIDFKNLQSVKEFSNWQAYYNSNLAKMLFTHELSRRLKGTNVTVNSACPGRSVTNLYQNVFPYNYKIWWFFMSPWTYLFWKSAGQGQETIYYCALDRYLEKISGQHFVDCKKGRVKDIARDDGISKKLFEISDRLTLPKKISILNTIRVENVGERGES